MVAFDEAEFNNSEFDLATYKRGLAYVEEELAFYKKNEVMLCDQIVVLKRDASFRDSEINAFNIQIEKLKKEKESNQIKIDKFENASESLDKLIARSSRTAATTLVAARPINISAPKLFVNVAKTKPNVFQKEQSLSRRPFNQQTALNNRSLNNKVNTAKVKYVNTTKGKRVTSAVGKQGINAVKSSACWVWRPKRNIVDHTSKNSGSYILDAPEYDRNKSLLNRLSQDYDGGFVAFAGSSKDYLIKSSYVKILRKDNMYSFDLKNVVPSKGLTCLIAKATNDEFNMWHRRLGHINFKTMNKLRKGNLVRGSGPEWLFDIDTLKNSMNYHPVNARNKTNGNTGLETNSDARQVGKENVPDQEYILLPLLHTGSNVPLNSEKDESLPKDDAGKKNEVKDSTKEANMNGPGEATNTDSTNRLNTVSLPVNTVSSPVNTVSSSFTNVDPGRAKEQRNKYESLFDPLIPDLEDTTDLQDTNIFGSAYDDEYVGAEADLSNLETNMSVSSIPTTKIHKDHPKGTNSLERWILCCTTKGTKKGNQAGDDESWGRAMLRRDSLVFKLTNVWTLGIYPMKEGHWCRTEFEQLMHKRFQMSSMGELTFFLGLQIKQIKDGIFLSQDKYVYDILKKFGFSNVHDWIIKVQPKVSHMHAVKRIFRYLKGQPTLGLWYPKDSPMDLIAYSDSDYVGASIDRKSTTGEYIAAYNCYGQVLWLQNQLLDYGYNFMKTQIHVDNESAICVVKNPVYHSKTKHIEIRHHFIRDSHEKKLIEMVKIHTDYNVADLLTKAFDVTSLVVPLTKVGDEAVHKELGDRMERAATTASSFEAEQDSDAQTRFEAASKSPKIHLSQEVTHLEVGRTTPFDIQKGKEDLIIATLDQCILKLATVELATNANFGKNRPKNPAGHTFHHPFNDEIPHSEGNCHLGHPIGNYIRMQAFGKETGDRRRKERGGQDKGGQHDGGSISEPDIPRSVGCYRRRTPKTCKSQLRLLLKDNIDIFFLEPADITGVPRRVIEHNLNVNDSIDPERQKWKVLAPEKSDAVAKDVDEWVKSSIVRPVRYPTWISNSILVKKCDGAWRMCIGFKNLNSTCPKDFYPLPNIDCKVESVMGFKYKCFLDAYKGYHQIQMSKEDEEKTTFYMDQGTYCYTKMPFGLKNAGATYQRLIDSTFQSQIGRNLEAYVDDMVIKSNDKKMFLADVAETFDNLRKINMKLNSKNALLESKRSLAGKLVALNRFLAKPAERSLPFFNTLKNITKENKHEYKWTIEAEEAFKKLKRFIIKLSSLTLHFRKKLWTRTWRYQRRREASGKLAKYVIELGVYNITFEPRNSIKAQVLADFITETPNRESPEGYFRTQEVAPKRDDTEEWTLFTDGESSVKESGAGLVLIGLSGVEHTYALRLTFDNTNNEEEYEALLAGLRTARGMNIQNIEIKAKEYIACFKSFSIKNIPGNQNQKADVLSKLASLAFNHLTKEVLVEVLNERSMEVIEINNVVEEEGDNWMTPIIKCLEKEVWPKDKNEDRNLQVKINQYIMEDESLSIKNILRNQNQKADVLSKLASLSFNHLTKEVLVEVLNERSMEVKEINNVVEEEGDNWMTPIIQCLEKEVWPKDKNKSRNLQVKFNQYTMEHEFLNDPFKIWCSRLNIQQMNTSVAHLQANKLVERENEILMEEIKTKIGREKVVWVDELPNVLWAHQTSIKTSNGESPFSLTYGSEAVIPAEIGLPDQFQARGVRLPKVKAKLSGGFEEDQGKSATQMGQRQNIRDYCVENSNVLYESMIINMKLLLLTY
ncbi:reverse transcriptase domain-containing protein [Tanacetum coccineum]